jgi:hypothetical protein
VLEFISDFGTAGTVVAIAVVVVGVGLTLRRRRGTVKRETQGEAG